MRPGSKKGEQSEPPSHGHSHIAPPTLSSLLPADDDDGGGGGGGGVE